MGLSVCGAVSLPDKEGVSLSVGEDVRVGTLVPDCAHERVELAVMVAVLVAVEEAMLVCVVDAEPEQLMLAVALAVLLKLCEAVWLLLELNEGEPVLLKDGVATWLFVPVLLEEDVPVMLVEEVSLEVIV